MKLKNKILIILLVVIGFFILTDNKSFASFDVTVPINDNGYTDVTVTIYDLPNNLSADDYNFIITNAMEYGWYSANNRTMLALHICAVPKNVQVSTRQPRFFFLSTYDL